MSDAGVVDEHGELLSRAELGDFVDAVIRGEPDQRQASARVPARRGLTQ